MQIFKWYRKKIGGEWVKTKHRGWMTLENFGLYLSYGFDPIMLQSESYLNQK